MMNPFPSPARAKAALAAALLSALLVPPASAGLLEDDEARKAILDLRAKVEQIQRDLAARIETKADKTSALDLVAQNEKTLEEVAKLRGQIEVLANELVGAQRRQKDFYVDLDKRLAKLEPQKVMVDGKSAQVEPGEQKSYDASLVLFKAGDYKTAAVALSDFLRRYPESPYAATAQYWLGNAYYAQRDCRNAIAAQQVVVNRFADSPKAADAMLNIASCHTELKEKKEAKKVLEQLLAQYPDTDAGRTAKERLAASK